MRAHLSTCQGQCRHPTYKPSQLDPGWTRPWPKRKPFKGERPLMVLNTPGGTIPNVTWAERSRKFHYSKFFMEITMKWDDIRNSKGKPSVSERMSFYNLDILTGFHSCFYIKPRPPHVIEKSWVWEDFLCYIFSFSLFCCKCHHTYSELLPLPPTPQF